MDARKQNRQSLKVVEKLKKYTRFPATVILPMKKIERLFRYSQAPRDINCVGTQGNQNN